MPYMLNGALLIKLDAQSLASTMYSDIISVLVALRKRLRYPLYIPFTFYPALCKYFCKYK